MQSPKKKETTPATSVGGFCFWFAFFVARTDEVEEHGHGDHPLEETRHEHGPACFVVVVVGVGVDYCCCCYRFGGCGGWGIGGRG
jgi:hypothetical protein